MSLKLAILVIEPLLNLQEPGVNRLEPLVKRLQMTLAGLDPLGVLIDHPKEQGLHPMKESRVVLVTLGHEGPIVVLLLQMMHLILLKEVVLVLNKLLQALVWLPVDFFPHLPVVH